MKGSSFVWFCKNVDSLMSDSLVCFNTFLQKTTKTCDCRLCAMERLIIGHSITYQKFSKQFLNSKIDMFGACSCSTGFLRFCASKKGGSEEAN